MAQKQSWRSYTRSRLRNLQFLRYKHAQMLAALERNWHEICLSEKTLGKEGNKSGGVAMAKHGKTPPRRT
jgi:hypothetical protein